MITARALRGTDGVRHGFFTRKGGVSRGPYRSLNCSFGSGDDDRHVVENRARAMARLGLGPSALCTARQVHGRDVAVVKRPWEPHARQRADGLVTRRRGLALAILTADCAPVLLADGHAGVVGAVHAGWKGTLAGVMESMGRAMTGLGATGERIVAAIGPCIAQPSYEVGPEFRAAFLEADRASDAFFVPAGRPGRFLFDLPGYVARRLERLGLGTVVRLAFDSCTEESRFFSYRRARLRG
ncbi:MAG: peptidoglycan editing factor PgeF, partial [Alphaproteobacteria bacterium]